MSEIYVGEKQVTVMQVIRTTLTVRGEGTQDCPLRRITQYWDMDGRLLTEWDPLPDKPEAKP